MFSLTQSLTILKVSKNLKTMFQNSDSFVILIFILPLFLHKYSATCSELQGPSPYDRVLTYRLNVERNLRDYEENTTLDENTGKIKQALLTIFDRPFEPVFMPKGLNNTVFIIPDHYWVDRHKHLRTRLEAVYDSLGVEIKERFIVKDLGNKVLSINDALVQKSFVSIVKVFLEVSSLEDVLSLSVYIRDRISPYMFLQVLYTVIIHRHDTSGMYVPCIAEVTDTAMEEDDFHVPSNPQMPVTVPLEFDMSSELDEEQSVAYFRKDFGNNLNHQQFHKAYSNLPPYNKDRRGELFFFFHQQILSRYNFERVCNNKLRTLPLNNFREPIKEGYFPKLHCSGGKTSVPARRPNTTMTDVVHKKENIALFVKDMEDWRDRIYEAIHNRHVITREGEVLELNETDGIEILGNLVSANPMSVNIPYYGNLHNTGHNLLSFIHDPEGVYEEPRGPMAVTSLSMIDPVFYRWHEFLNNLFMEHKHLLPGYKEDQLEFKEVQMKSVEIRSSGSNQKNTLYTMWQQNERNISNKMILGLPGKPKEVILHLQHQPFSYSIQVENSGNPKKGICRIYLAPKFEIVPLPLKDRKNLFIEMDRFIVDLPNGLNTIKRRSEDSSVTIPYEMTFGNAGSMKTNGTYERCGWPHHMMVPKGSAKGIPSQLFVMISDYESDKVEDSITFGTPELFKRGGTLCGQQGKYPDKRPMMYPFDRIPRVDTLEEFLTPNMIVADVIIYHSNKTVR